MGILRDLSKGAKFFEDEPNPPVDFFGNPLTKVKLPIKDIEHGESALPGGKLTWKDAEARISDYAQRETDIPPISVMADDEIGIIVDDGSHRLEAAKRRGQKHIDAYVGKEDLPFLKNRYGKKDLETNSSAFTGGKPDVSGGLMSAISSGAGYMPSDDTDYGEDATSAYADIPEQIWNNMSMLDKAALVTSPIPVVGAGTGILADLANMYNNPEERTGLNAALLAANVIPGAKIADAAGGILGSVRKMADDYRGAHTAPMRDSGAPAHELAGDIYPEDFYSPEGFNYYANFGGAADRESYNIARSLRGNPDADVTIYRAVPKGTKDINKGDWVAVSKKYAKEHGESALGGDYEIISKKVKAKDIYTNGDSINEWGYDPSKAK